MDAHRVVKPLLSWIRNNNGHLFALQRHPLSVSGGAHNLMRVSGATMANISAGRGGVLDICGCAVPFVTHELRTRGLPLF